MKTEANYSRKYKKKEENSYYSLIGEIRKNSIEETTDPRKFLLFDGDFLLRLSSDLGFIGNSYTARVKIEKWGKNLEQQSEIEKILIEKKFKLDRNSK